MHMFFLFQMRHMHTLFSIASLVVPVNVSLDDAPCRFRLFTRTHKLSIVLLFCRCTYGRVNPLRAGGYSHIFHCNNTFIIPPP
ncbi:hypothetical protein H4582DRAFT_417513 [Lactarius indigo]|nr:hypothetical protein H4582DRAFT_417513 [Lactarius indigo]